MEESARYASIVVAAVMTLLSSIAIFASIEYEAYLEGKTKSTKTEARLKLVSVIQLGMVAILAAATVSFFLVLSEPNSLLKALFWVTVGIACAYFMLTVVTLTAILVSIAIGLFRRAIKL